MAKTPECEWERDTGRAGECGWCGGELGFGDTRPSKCHKPLRRTGGPTELKRLGVEINPVPQSMTLQGRYSDGAVRRAKDNALGWLQDNADGYPRSWQQESLNDKQLGYVMYDDFEAPSIAGYEALEREGAVVRLETVVRSDEERIHFRRAVGEGDKR